MTYSTLQTMSNGETTSPVAQMTLPLAGDDASVAKLIAERYEKAGLNPNSAYDNPDDALNELGLQGLI